MREFAGKAAFVTSGASGIGLALGRAFAEAGCKVMLADIEKAALDAALASLSSSGPEIRALSVMSQIPLPSTPLPKQPSLPSAMSIYCVTTREWVRGAASIISRSITGAGLSMST